MTKKTIGLDSVFFVRSLDALLAKHQVTKIRMVNENIGCGALLLKIKNEYEILVSGSLCQRAQNFAILHELGHIELGIIISDPRPSHDPGKEYKVNRWAIEQLCVDSSNRSILLAAFAKNEDHGYQTLLKLKEDL